MTPKKNKIRKPQYDYETMKEEVEGAEGSKILWWQATTRIQAKLNEIAFCRNFTLTVLNILNRYS